MWHDLVEVDSEVLLHACPLPEEVERLHPVQLSRVSQGALCGILLGSNKGLSKRTSPDTLSKTY